MSDAKQVLETAINNFSIDSLNQFFREKSRQFVAREENYSRHNDDDFKNGSKLGEINFPDSDCLIICIFEVKRELSERAGKKAQYEKAKNILKSIENQKFSAGIFVFYDPNGNFRFSLVYPESVGTHRQWNNFRRFTYFVSSDPQVTNKTFKQRIGDGNFSSLEKIKEAFSVEKVTKEFYQDIANWYFWAVQNVKFPEMAKQEENSRNMAVIRMITRLIFIWFMKECGLVPNILFDQPEISKLLKDLSSEKTTYYKAILQNLFFATLNTKNQDRKYRFGDSFQGKNKDYMDHSIYRYEDYFSNQEAILTVFKNIPFLNGGLFDCLDRRSIENGRNVEVRIDGFTDKEVGLRIPNFLFFSDLANVDLNQEYGTRNKEYSVRGIINILSTYNFTIDENSPDDQDIALDPELLGKVFENLLASFNPETSTTARKATGSYYTPREIVDYMVTESLKAYFRTHLSEIINLDEKLERLFSTENQENPFNVLESKKIVELIESVRIVDPAVGSGAFPMGALNKLVFILNKVDFGNELWKQAQLKAAETIPDQNVRSEAKEKIEIFFQIKNINYLRKLYLIQKCIYGVDIQQIALEIAKLRFFISLLVDEKIDKNKENWGIEPLPNLDFKIMQGNSLIELFSPEFLAKRNDIERNKLIDEFNELKSDFFNIHDTKEKRAQKEKIDQQITTIANYDREMKKTKLSFRAEAFRNQGKLFVSPGENLNFNEVKNKEDKEMGKIDEELKNLEQIDKVSPVDHFEWYVYFNEVFEKDGFDIVIGNPPYIRQEKFSDIKPVLKKQYGDFFNGRADLYTYFIARGVKLLKEDGILTFITSNKFFVRGYGENTRSLLTKDITLKKVVNFGELPVFQASVDSSIVLAKNKKPKEKDSLNFAQAKTEADIKNIHEFFETKKGTIKLTSLGSGVWSLQDPEKLTVLNKIKSQKNTLGAYYDGNIFAGIKSGLDSAFVISKKIKDELIKKDIKSKELINPWFRGKDISRWQADFKDLYVIYIPLNKLDIDDYPAIKEHLTQFKLKLEKRATQQKWFEMQQPQERFTELFKSPKIVYAEIAKEMRACFDINKSYGTMKMFFIPYDPIILGVLNSKLFDWYARMTFATLGDPWEGGRISFNTMYMSAVPIPDIKNNVGALVKNGVDKILAITKSIDYLENPIKKEEVREYEKQIDQMVYKLYDLTPEEIEVVENQK